MITPQNPNAKSRILVVDDDRSVRRLLEMTFGLEGYDVGSAVDGEAALVEAESTTPDLIVLDVMMPGIDGVEVCRRLRAIQSMRTVPVILLSAKAQREDIEAGLACGAQRYVTKPFDPAALVALVALLLQG